VNYRWIVRVRCLVLKIEVSKNPIPHQLQQFIAEHVDSLEHMEILCLLSGRPEKSWQVAEVFREVQSSEKSVADCLRKFANRKLVIEANGAYRLSPEKHALVSELAASYRERRVTIIELIYKPPTAPIEDFAEAFRLKRKENQ
jgi:hypothetical protein